MSNLTLYFANIIFDDDAKLGVNYVKIRLAQYGISHDHAGGKARVLKESDEVEFVGVFEPSPEVQETIGKSSVYDGVHWFSTKEEMLADESIVGIAAQGRVSQNLTFAREILEHGKHVWFDKPAGDSLDEFQVVLNIARDRKLLVQLGYMFRYNAGFQFVLDWVNSGKLGEIFSVRGRISSGLSNEGHWKRWDSLGEHSGGIMFILACHLTDIIVALLGRPTRVTPFLRHDVHDVPWYRNNTAAVLEYPNALAVLESTALEIDSGKSRRLEVYGTRGSAILEPLEPPALRLCLDEERDGYSKGWQTVSVEAKPRYVESLQAFVSDIRGEKTPDRSLDHEFTVQETVLRVAGLI
ncbi:MAG: Gfo/Idh/MocA family oxidoreductase [Candidatus Poribacteria bacterium]|nr:Gfo/Idh/MocA family oxidoreductase [Candidatus Poribacteria bacterium]